MKQLTDFWEAGFEFWERSFRTGHHCPKTGGLTVFVPSWMPRSVHFGLSILLDWRRYREHNCWQPVGRPLSLDPWPRRSGVRCYRKLGRL